jgi:hypothetical protein
MSERAAEFWPLGDALGGDARSYDGKKRHGWC